MDRIELIKERTSNTKRFLNKDRSIDIEIYDRPIHYLKNNEYVEIKTEEDRNRAVIDEVTSNQVIDTYIYPGDTNKETYKEDIIKAGIERVNNKDIINRSLLSFTLPNVPASYSMVNATLYLTGYIKENYDEFASNEQLTVHKITDSWNEKIVNWDIISDKYNRRIEECFFANRSPVTINGNEAILENPTIIPVDITNMVKDWYNGEPNYGLMIKAYNEVYNSNVISGEFFSKDFNNNIIQPRLRINFKNFSGIDSYLTYTSSNHELGSSNINNFNGNLVSTFNVGNTVGGPLSADLNLTYNTSDIVNTNEVKEYGCGLSFKPNYIQIVEEENNNLLKYLDETSAIHYFYKIDNIYKDEDGLFLTLEKIDNNYIMTDKDKNTSKYVKHSNNKYYLEEIKDTSGNIITINYDNSNRIIKIIDASNKEINITYENNKVSFISPYKTVIASLVNNQITSIENLGNVTNITYNSNKLIDKILNSNGLYSKYEYLNEYNYKVSKVIDYGRDNVEGNYLEFTYNLKSTSVKDRKGLINNYTFNNLGNTDGITSLDKDKNLNDAYGKSYVYGEDGTSSVNRIKQDNFILKYVNNLINNSSFEDTTNNVFSTLNDKIYLSIIEDGNNDTRALCVNKHASGSSNIYLNKMVEKGKYYTFSAYIKNDISYTLELSYDDVVNEIPVSSINNEYERQMVTIFYPEDATSDLKITIIPNGIGELFIDDIQLEEGRVANYYNLINNSNFIEGISYYEIESYKRTGYEWNFDVVPMDNASVEVVNVTDKVKALRFINSPSIQTMLSSHYGINGKKGDVYNLSFWYKNEGRNYIPTEDSIMINPEPSFVQTSLVFDYINYEDMEDQEFKITEYNNDWHFFSKKIIAKEDYNGICLNILNFCEIGDFYITNISLFKDVEGFSYTYDDNGNLVSSVDSANEMSKFDYNSNNQLIKATTPLGQTYKYEYDTEVVDRLRRAISPSSITNEIEYDQYSNPIRTIITNTGVFEELENKNYYIRARGTDSYLYIKPDKTLMVRENKCSHDIFKLILLPDNKVKIQYTVLNNYYIKDNNGALKVEYGDNNNIFELIKNTNKSYTLKTITGNLAITFNSDHELSLTTYSENKSDQQFLFEIAEKRLFIESSADYTDDGRFIKSVTDSVGNTYTYDSNNTNGLLNSITDPNDNATNYTYDSKLRVTKIEKNNHKVSYEYFNNNLSKIIFGTDNYIFNYDNYNNISNVKINNNTLVNNTYEPYNGNLTKVTYGNNSSINYTYDKLNRLESIIKENNTYTNYYDNLNRISKLISNDTTHLYEYDFASRLSTYRNSNNYESTYNYDKDNNVIEKTEQLNNKYVYNYEYNNDNSLTKLTNNNNVFNYNYDLLGRLTSQNINNNYNTNYSYITHTYKTSTMIDKVDDNGTEYSYTYDKLGNITEIRKNNTLTNKYYYDEYSELIKEDDLLNKLTKVYTYDNYGNILSKKIYTYNTTNLLKEDKYEYKNSNWQDLLTKYNNESITYDTIGNPLSIGNKTLTWINGRELATYSDGVNSISYKYNLNGVRTSKIVNGVETKYYLEGNRIIFEDRNNNMIYYIYNGEEILGFVYKNKTYYYHKNIFGDIIGILDSNYKEIVSYEYDSWGALLNITDTSTINLGIINPFRYRSYYYDTETQLYYLNSRYYNPEWGRFVNADSVVLGNYDITSGNLFQYVSNNPVNNSDITGNRLVGALVNFGVKLGNAIREVAPFLGTAGGLSAADGPLPFGDILGGAIALGGTAWALYESYNIGKSKTKEKAESIPQIKTDVFPRIKKNKVYFPENPFDFKPKGLIISTNINTPDNGIILKWTIPGDKKAIFEWHESLSVGGEHYHINEIKYNYPGSFKDAPHFKPGEEIPEPYASIYFN